MLWIRIQGFYDQKLKKKHSWNFVIPFFDQGRPSNIRSLQPSKENIQHFKKLNLLTFFFLSESFLPSWIRIQIAKSGSGYGSRDPTKARFTTLTLFASFNHGLAHRARSVIRHAIIDQEPNLRTGSERIMIRNSSGFTGQRFRFKEGKRGRFIYECFCLKK